MRPLAVALALSETLMLAEIFVFAEAFVLTKTLVFTKGFVLDGFGASALARPEFPSFGSITTALEFFFHTYLLGITPKIKCYLSLKIYVIVPS